METFLLFIGIILLSLGVKLIYDARPIVRKYLATNNENKVVLALKIIGTVMSFIGVILVAKYLV